MGGIRIVYDNQADVFEARAGLPDEVARQVAATVHRWGEVGPDGLLVEIGAGTGVIGRWLAPLPGRYLGIDSSLAMLGRFLPRLPTGGAALALADADRPWPMPSDSASVIFGSRVLHLLDPAHALAEACRVAHPAGALLLCGRVEHDRRSPRTRTRARLRELLTEHGLRPEPTGGRPTRLFTLAQARGAEPLTPRVAGVWPEAVTATLVIDWWRGKTSIGGVNPTPEVAERILATLTAWAADTFGEPAPVVTTHTRYLLEGIRLPPVAPATPAAPSTRSGPTPSEETS